MKAFVRKIDSQGREGVASTNATVIISSSYYALYQHANAWAQGSHWRMYVYHDHDKCYGDADRVIERGEQP